MMYKIAVIIIFTLFVSVFSSKANNLQLTDNDSINIDKNDTISYILVNKSAMFNNGNANDFRLYVQDNIKYSRSLVKKDKVIAIIQFVIDKSGITRDFKLIQSCGLDDLDKEAIRTIKDCPKWTPAMIDDKKVNQRMTIPVIFDSKK